MNTGGRPTIRFTLNGATRELTREQVTSSLIGVVPGQIRKHAVLVDGTWFPAIQAFEVATGIPRSEFISHTARRHLASLGFEISGEINPPTDRVPPSVVKPSLPSKPNAAASAEREWHTEANVQAALVTALAGAGWRILSVANTLTKEHGIDVIATSLDGSTAGVEVKGFPSRHYADPARGRAETNQPKHPGGALVLAGSARSDAPTWS
jgi:hypothetical protein